MIELQNDRLEISFPELHPAARMTIEFQRTLRIPDDDRDHFLPPGMGVFPLRHVDDHAERVPGMWRRHGGVMLPMYQSEAMWLNFFSPEDYPFALKVAAGKINAVTGDEWADGLSADPQNYLAIPEQPWLDGFCVEKGVIRQFVAMPLGAGYSAEEQLTGKAEHGGLQIEVFPIKPEFFKRASWEMNRLYGNLPEASADCCIAGSAMSLAPGGRMKQKIYDDEHPLSHYDTDHRSRCFVHLCNSLVWRQITGHNPPTVPPTATEYEEAGLPWFDYYSDAAALDGSAKLGGLKSVATMGKEKGDVPLPENESVVPKKVVPLGPKSPDQVREGEF
jgi:hypothetical protein